MSYGEDQSTTHHVARAQTARAHKSRACTSLQWGEGSGGEREGGGGGEGVGFME